MKKYTTATGEPRLPTIFEVQEKNSKGAVWARLKSIGTAGCSALSVSEALDESLPVPFRVLAGTVAVGAAALAGTYHELANQQSQTAAHLQAEIVTRFQ